MKIRYIIFILSLIFLLFLVIFFSLRHKKETSEEKVIKREEIIEGPTEIKPIEGKVTQVEAIDKELVVAEIKEKIASGNPYRKQEAIKALVAIGDEGSIRQIEELTRDLTPSVVNSALSALGELKSEASIPLINEVSEENRIRRDGHGESIRMNAVSALGEIGTEKSVDILGEELARNNVSFGFNVVDALGKISSEKSLPYLEQYKAFLEEQLAAMPGAEDIGEYRYVWEQAARQVNEVIDKTKGGR